MIGVSQTSLKVGGFQSKALLAFSEADGSQGNLWKYYCHYIILWRNFSLEAQGWGLKEIPIPIPENIHTQPRTASMF